MKTHKVRINGKETTLTRSSEHDKRDARGEVYPGYVTPGNASAHTFTEELRKGMIIATAGKVYEVLS